MIRPVEKDLRMPVPALLPAQPTFDHVGQGGELLDPGEYIAPAALACDNESPKSPDPEGHSASEYANIRRICNGGNKRLS